MIHMILRPDKKRVRLGILRLLCREIHFSHRVDFDALVLAQNFLVQSNDDRAVERGWIELDYSWIESHSITR